VWVWLLFNFQEFDFAVNVASSIAFRLLSQLADWDISFYHLARCIKTLLFEWQNLLYILHDCFFDTFLAIPSSTFNFLPKSDCAKALIIYKPKLLAPLLQAANSFAEHFGTLLDSFHITCLVVVVLKSFERLRICWEFAWQIDYLSIGVDFPACTTSLALSRVGF